MPEHNDPMTTHAGHPALGRRAPPAVRLADRPPAGRPAYPQPGRRRRARGGRAGGRSRGGLRRPRRRRRGHATSPRSARPRPSPRCAVGRPVAQADRPHRPRPVRQPPGAPGAVGAPDLTRAARRVPDPPDQVGRRTSCTRPASTRTAPRSASSRWCCATTRPSRRRRRWTSRAPTWPLCPEPDPADGHARGPAARDDARGHGRRARGPLLHPVGGVRAQLLRGRPPHARATWWSC